MPHFTHDDDAPYSCWLLDAKGRPIRRVAGFDVADPIPQGGLTTPGGYGRHPRGEPRGDTPLRATRARLPQRPHA